MYYVIFFDDWCSIVPDVWVDVKARTFKWPPKEINVRRAAQKNIFPCDDWDVQQYRRIVGPYDYYETAIQAEKRAETVSTSDEGPMQALSQGYSIMQEPQKRTIKRSSFHDELENYSKTEMIHQDRLVKVG